MYQNETKLVQYLFRTDFHKTTIVIFNIKSDKIQNTLNFSDKSFYEGGIKNLIFKCLVLKGKN